MARESSELILTDDNFASIVAGVEEGRVAYGNVRKVIFLLVSSGAAEVLLFVLTTAAGLPVVDARPRLASAREPRALATFSLTARPLRHRARFL